jgi:hypothetical protein
VAVVYSTDVGFGAGGGRTSVEVAKAQGGYDV